MPPLGYCGLTFKATGDGWKPSLHIPPSFRLRSVRSVSPQVSPQVSQVCHTIMSILYNFFPSYSSSRRLVQHERYVASIDPLSTLFTAKKKTKKKIKKGNRKKVFPLLTWHPFATQACTAAVRRLFFLTLTLAAAEVGLVFSEGLKSRSSTFDKRLFDFNIDGRIAWATRIRKHKRGSR